jgi:hypothetical protein
VALHNKEFIPVRNLAVAAVAALIVLLIYLLPGYRFATEIIGFGGLRQVEEFKEAARAQGIKVNIEDKWKYRVTMYPFLKFIAETTPPDAIILLPPKSAIKEAKYEFIFESEWVEYFIYPRLCVGEDEKLLLPELYKRVNYVTLVNGWGYDKLHYELKDRMNYGVAPIDAPDSTQTP